MTVYLRPTSLDEALELSARYADSIVAGGTVWMPLARRHMIDQQTFVDITGVEELKKVEQSVDRLFIGAAVTLHRLENTHVDPQITALTQAAAGCASPEIRRQATIGGNVEAPFAPGDLIPALLVLGADAEVASSDDRRTIPVSDYITPLGTHRRPGELLVGFSIPMNGGVTAFRKVGRRRSFSQAAVTASAFFQSDGAGCISELRLAVGAGRRPPSRLKECEEAGVGAELGPALAKQLGTMARNEIVSQGEYWISPEYRAALGGVVVERLLTEIWAG